MDRRRRRRRSIIVLVVMGALVGAMVGFVAWAGRPEVVRTFAATATFDSDGTAAVHEAIEYFFPSTRHGIYRNIPGIPWNERSRVSVVADHTGMYTVEPDTTQIQADMARQGVDQVTVDASELRGIRVKIGDPTETVSGLHRYDIRYPLYGATLGGDRIGWNGVGAAWDVPIESVALVMAAPWKWENPRCDVGGSGSVGGCTVTQTEPGVLAVHHGRLAAGEGITVYADAGASLSVAPSAHAVATPVADLAFWQRPRTLALGSLVLFVLGGLAVARLFRLLGRDWVMAGPASTNAAADLAYSAPSMARVPAGAIRVDDRRLAEWAGTEFSPPRELATWQGGLVYDEVPRIDHRVAWVLQAAIDGYVDIDQSDSGTVTLKRLDHDVDRTSQLLDSAFAGRGRITLGAYDPSFAAMWGSLRSMQKRWLGDSVYVDHRGGRRVVFAVVGGVAATMLAAFFGLVGAAISPHASLAALVCGAAAFAGGAGLMAAVRSWELRVRTPAGSAVWLRIESFRKFLAGSEAEHVRQAAQRGVLREYTAWAVALGEADHWNAQLAAAGLSPETSGLATSLAASHLTTACMSAGTAPSSSGSGGGGGFSSGGVGGGGGGGGGGSW